MKRVLVDTTRQITWVSCGTTVTSAYAVIFDVNSVVVNSVALTSSGSGQWHAEATFPSSFGLYVLETRATIEAKEYKHRLQFKSVVNEVD